MKIVVDENITSGLEAFSLLGKVELYDGRQISNTILKNADALIVRAITDVNEKLLHGTQVKFVGTATIGTDHIDLRYLSQNGIAFADAKGCNANSVVEYIFAVLFKFAAKENFSLSDKSLGVIGAGDIGGRVVKIAEKLGMKVKKNDPPLERSGLKGFNSLEDALQSNIVTFHVPLISEGIDKTFHLINKSNFHLLMPGTIIINTSRGAVLENNSLIEAIGTRNFKVVLDVWENEPKISNELLAETLLATPHIAGHSYEGKILGTKFIYDKLCNFLEKEINWTPPIPIPDKNIIDFPAGKSFEERMDKLISLIYDIEEENKRMKKILKLNAIEAANYFDDLRRGIPKRREFYNFMVKIKDEEPDVENKIKLLGFKTFRV